MLKKITIWLSAKEAAKKISRSVDTVNRRGVAWPPEGEYGHNLEERIPYKLRWKGLRMDPDGEPEKRFLEDDVEALLEEPTPPRQPKMGLDLSQQ